MQKISCNFSKGVLGYPAEDQGKTQNERKIQIRPIDCRPPFPSQ